MADLTAQWSDFYITDNGLSMRQKAIAEKLQIAFVRAEIGQGVPAQVSDIWTLNTLVSSSKRVQIKKSYEEKLTHYMVIHIDNKDYLEEILMREIGVFAALVDGDGQVISNEILYGYSYALHGSDPIPAGKSYHSVWDIGANTGISRTSDVNLIYDGSVVYVTHDEYDLSLPNTKLITINHNLNRKPQVLLGTLRYGLSMGGLGEGPLGGTDTTQRPAQAIYHDSQSLTVLTLKPVAELGRQAPELHRISPQEYTVTWPDNALDSVYIRLI